jgi:hypothetical protein
MNWYSVLFRKESAMPPCHPATPAPAAIASSRPRNCSLLISLIVHTGTIRSSEPINPVSR